METESSIIWNLDLFKIVGTSSIHDWSRQIGTTYIRNAMIAKYLKERDCEDRILRELKTINLYSRRKSRKEEEEHLSLNSVYKKCLSALWKATFFENSGQNPQLYIFFFCPLNLEYCNIIYGALRLWFLSSSSVWGCYKSFV